MSGSANVLDRVKQAAEDYDGLLSRMEQTTSELMEAIEGWDVERVGLLIEDRSKLCDEIGQSIDSIHLLESEVEADSGAESPIWKLEAAMNRMRERHRSILDRQRDAEEALAAELNRRRAEAVKWKSAWAGHAAAGAGPSGARSRFLDSRT